METDGGFPLHPVLRSAKRGDVESSSSRGHPLGAPAPRERPASLVVIPGDDDHLANVAGEPLGSRSPELIHPDDLTMDQASICSSVVACTRAIGHGAGSGEQRICGRSPGEEGIGVAQGNGEGSLAARIRGWCDQQEGK